MAHVEKRGGNSYRLVVYVGYHPDGRKIPKKKTIKANGTREAEKELAKFIVEVEAGEYIAPEKMTFKAFVEEWKQKYAQGHLEPLTYKTYLTHIKNHIMPAFENMRLDQVKPIHIITFLEELSTTESLKGNSKTEYVKTGSALSSGTIEYIYRVLRNIFARAADWKIIKSNPVADVKKPKVTEKEIDVYDEEETAAVFIALEKEAVQWRMMITLALTTGLRRGELLGLEWKHIDLEKGTIDVKQSISLTKDGAAIIKEPKTKSSLRKISLPESVIEDLKEYRSEVWKKRDNAKENWEGGERFFVFSTLGKPIYHTTPSKWWKRFVERNEMRYIRFHDLRHTSATILINQGVHAKIISSRLGHASISQTMNTYGHALQSADQSAANKFDSLLQSRGRKTK